ncbi:MAG: alpha/beta hydrolase [Acidobacteria bacterium]|nr:alpha/beta hydrolase [Acidobacteriota bacterium]
MAHPPPGVLVEIGRHRLHLRSEGTGAPAVVFDAALGASSLSWSLVLPAVAQTTRAVAYDRAGFGWSDAGPVPRTAGRLADELHELLRRADVPPPYLLVGHSFGGLVMRLLAARHRGRVAGLVLIEPAHPEDWRQPSAEQRRLIDRGVRLCRHGTVAARLGLARVVAALVGLGALGSARTLVTIVSRGGLRREDEGILAPIWRLPPDARAVLKQMWTQPKFFEALGSQIESICESAHELARESPADFGDLPLVVVTAAGASEHRLTADAALARRSSRGRHVIVADRGHWIPLDAPEAVADVIVDTVTEIRATRRT